MSDQLNSITEQLTANEGTSRKADLESRNQEDESADLLNLLKKTQSQVTSLENEITKIEAENIHQEKGWIVSFPTYNIRIFKIPFKRLWKYIWYK